MNTIDKIFITAGALVVVFAIYWLGSLGYKHFEYDQNSPCAATQEICSDEPEFTGILNPDELISMDAMCACTNPSGRRIYFVMEE
jgi:hypothetical protein